jgi:hypothetical protein
MKVHMYDVEKEKFTLSIDVRWIKLLAKFSKQFKWCHQQLAFGHENVPRGICFRSEGKYYIMVNDVGKVNDYVMKHELAHIQLGHVGNPEKADVHTIRQQDLDADKYALEVLKCDPVLMWKTLCVLCDELDELYFLTGYKDDNYQALYYIMLDRLNQAEKLIKKDEIVAEV